MLLVYSPDGVVDCWSSMLWWSGGVLLVYSPDGVVDCWS